MTDTIPPTPADALRRVYPSGSTEAEILLTEFRALLQGPTGDGQSKRNAGLKEHWTVDKTHTAAALRHLARWVLGEVEDEDSGFHPLAHAAWRLLAVAWQERESGWLRDNEAPPEQTVGEMHEADRQAMAKVLTSWPQPRSAPPSPVPQIQQLRERLIEAIYHAGEKRNVSTHLADVVLDALGLERVGVATEAGIASSSDFIVTPRSGRASDVPLYRLTALSGRSEAPRG